MRCKGRSIISILFLAFTIIFFNSINVSAADEDKLKVSHSYGFESVYKTGYLVPITIEIDNNLKNIDGEVQIEVPINNFNNGMTNKGVTIYSQNINLPLNTKKKVTLNVPIARNLTSVKMNVVEGKNKLFTKELSLGNALNPVDFIIGTLSDDFNSVSYINKATINFQTSVKRSFVTKLVRLDENTLSEDVNVLKAINIIFINNFDTSKLSKTKYETLKKWVDRGGLLLIGTGPSYNKTLSIFKDNFISGDIGNLSSVDTKGLSKILDSNSNNSMKLDVLNITAKDGIGIIKEGNVMLVQKMEKGKGSVALCSFDFGLSPLTNWQANSTFGEQLIAKVLPDYYSDPSYERTLYNGASYNISNMLGNIPELPIPKASNLIIIFLVYVIIVAPVNYFILKKKDKRELMWFTVPALSIIFAIVVYFAGSTTRMTKPVANVMSTIEIDNKGNQLVQSYGAVVTPNKSNIKVETSEGLDLRPLVDLNYYDKGPVPTTNSNETSIFSKVVTAPKTTVEFYNTAVFGQYSFILDSNESRKGAVLSEVNFSDNKLNGVIRNNTGLDFSECYIITPKSYIELGEIKTGEVKNINEPVKTYMGQGYDLLNTMFGYQGGGPLSSDKAIKEKRINEQKRALLQSYFENIGMIVKDNVLLAIADSPVKQDILVNNNIVKRYGKSLVISKVNLSYINGDKAEYPVGAIVPQVIIGDGQSSGNVKLGYDEMNGIIHGESGTIELRYSIDKKVKAENIELKEAQNNPNMGKFAMIEGKGSVWNETKNNWESIDYKDFSVSGDKASQYIDKNNVFKLKIEISSMQNGAGSIPQIYVKGSVK